VKGLAGCAALHPPYGPLRYGPKTHVDPGMRDLFGHRLAGECTPGGTTIGMEELTQDHGGPPVRGGSALTGIAHSIILLIDPYMVLEPVLRGEEAANAGMCSPRSARSERRGLRHSARPVRDVSSSSSRCARPSAWAISARPTNTRCLGPRLDICRGPWCVLSFEAVAVLRQRGYRVRRLEDGFPEWKVAGFPVAIP
jgi:hypothetical protein